MPQFDQRAFNIKINNIQDSIRLRMPGTIKTESVIKLYCKASVNPTEVEFAATEGVGLVSVVSKKTNEIPFMERSELSRAVIEVMKEGVLIASKHDTGFKPHINTIFNYLNLANEPFDYYRKIKRSHRSRKYKAEGIIHIQPDEYLSQILVTDKSENTERITVSKVEPLLGCVDLGFDKLLWDGDFLLGIANGQKRFEIEPELLRN